MRTKKVLWAEVDLGAFRNNMEIIRASVKEGTKICAVLKANAYGHDSVEVGRMLEREGLADYFAVSRTDEALVLRRAGIKLPILNLGYTSQFDYENSILNDVSMTLYSLDDARAMDETAARLNKKALVHIKVDTGMSRLGFHVDEESADEVAEICKLENLTIQGSFSHFATADCNREYARHQASEFLKMMKFFDERNIEIPIKHICNSAGIEEFQEYNFDMVRCGIILYGSQPLEDDMRYQKTKPLVSPMTLKSVVTHVKILPQGRGIGYGQVYHTIEDEKIASVAVGYADGFLRGQANPTVTINGRDYPVVGRICMDQIMVRVGYNDDIKPGDEVVIFGKGGKSIDKLAKECNTIPHEIMCLIAHRVPREIIDGDEFICERNYLL